MSVGWGDATESGREFAGRLFPFYSEVLYFPFKYLRKRVTIITQDEAILTKLFEIKVKLH